MTQAELLSVVVTRLYGRSRQAGARSQSRTARSLLCGFASPARRARVTEPPSYVPLPAPPAALQKAHSF